MILPYFRHILQIVYVYLSKRYEMKVFIPTNDGESDLIKEGFILKPLIIEAYRYHLNLSTEEKTQNLFNKKVKIGTATISKGNTRVL